MDIPALQKTEALLNKIQTSTGKIKDLADKTTASFNNISKGVDVVTKNVNKVGSSVDKFGKSIGNVGKGIKSIGTGVGSIGDGIGSIGTGINKIGQGFDKIGQGIGAFGSGIGSIGKGFDVVSAGVDRLGKGMTNAIESVSKFGDTIGSMGPKAKGALDSVYNGMQNLANSKDGIMERVKNIKTLASSMLNLKGLTGGLMNGFKSLGSFKMVIFDILRNSIKMFGGETIKTLQKGMGPLREALTIMAKTIAPILGPLFALAGALALIAGALFLGALFGGILTLIFMTMPSKGIVPMVTGLGNLSKAMTDAFMPMLQFTILSGIMGLVALFASSGIRKFVNPIIKLMKLLNGANPIVMAMAIVLGIMAIAMNASLWPVLAIIGAIALLVGAIVLVMAYWDDLKAKLLSFTLPSWLSWLIGGDDEKDGAADGDKVTDKALKKGKTQKANKKLTEKDESTSGTLIAGGLTGSFTNKSNITGVDGMENDFSGAEFNFGGGGTKGNSESLGGVPTPGGHAGNVVNNNDNKSDSKHVDTINIYSNKALDAHQLRSVLKMEGLC